ncbi:MAG: hypothetical protein ACI810_001313 [Gammaproteobacteria bacterium]
MAGRFLATNNRADNGSSIMKSGIDARSFVHHESLAAGNADVKSFGKTCCPSSLETQKLWLSHDNDYHYYHYYHDALWYYHNHNRHTYYNGRAGQLSNRNLW